MDSFVVLAEELSFTHAAQRLGISQPALSNRIQRLERELGAPLIERNSRRNWQLSDAGAHLFREVRTGLERLDAAVSEVQRLGKGEAGELHIGISPCVPAPFLADAIAAFRARSPGVGICLRESTSDEQVADLRRGALDLGLLRRRPSAPDLWCEQVARESLVAAVAVAPDLPKRGEVTSLEAFAEERFILVGRGGGDSPARSELTSICEGRGFTPQVVCEAPLGMALQLVAAGEGVALVPASSSRIPATGVCFLDIEDPPAVELIAVANPARRRLAASLFTEVLHSAGRILDARATRPAEASAAPSIDGAGPSLATQGSSK